MGVIFGARNSTLKYRYRKAVYAVIIKDGSLLTVINPRGHYFLPGGGTREGETNLQCLERELLEETGFTIANAQYIGRADLYFLSPSGAPIHNDGHFYYAALTAQKKKPLEQDYTTKWLDIEDCEKYLHHAHHVWAVKKFGNGFKTNVNKSCF